MKKNIISLGLACIMLFAGCGKKEAPTSNVLVKVGESTLTTGQFQFFLDEIKTQMEQELSLDGDWETAEIEGKKAIEVAKERAYEVAVEYLSCIEVAQKKGVTVTDEEIKSMKEQINTSYFEKYAEKDAIIDFMCRAEQYLYKMQQKYLEEKPLADGMVEAYFNDNREMFDNTYLRAKHVLILTQDEATREPLPEADIAERKVKADGILARAKAGEDFDALVKEYSEDPGSQANPDGYVFTSGEMVQEFEDCVRNLGYGEIGFAETPYGYHIIKRLELDFVSAKSVIEGYIHNEEFEKYMEGLASEYGIKPEKVEEEYNKIK